MLMPDYLGPFWLEVAIQWLGPDLSFDFNVYLCRYDIGGYGMVAEFTYIIM